VRKEKIHQKTTKTTGPVKLLEKGESASFRKKKEANADSNRLSTPGLHSSTVKTLTVDTTKKLLSKGGGQVGLRPF